MNGRWVTCQPPSDFCNRCSEPDDWPLRLLKTIAIFGSQDNATTSCQNSVRLPEQRPQQLGFPLPKGWLTVGGKKSRNGFLLLLFEGIVCVDTDPTKATG
jgi:hypothetical protein